MSCSADEKCLTRFTVACRVWGAASSIVFLGVAIEECYFRYPIGIFLLISALLMSFLESAFLVEYILKLVSSEESMCRKCWSFVLFIDNWKKTIIYLMTFVICFIRVRVPDSWLPAIPGSMCVILAALYLGRTYIIKKIVKNKILENMMSRDSSSSSLEVDDELDPSIIVRNPRLKMLQEHESVADQSSILEV